VRERESIRASERERAIAERGTFYCGSQVEF